MLAAKGTYGKGEVKIQHFQINIACIHRLAECGKHEKLTSLSKNGLKTLLPDNEYGQKQSKWFVSSHLL